jgi:hypothetical protein
MSDKNLVVATYANARLAQADIEKLQNAGIDARQFMLAEDAGQLHTALGCCVPEDGVRDYAAEMQAGRYILAAWGQAGEVDRVRNVIAADYPEYWDSHADCTVYYGCPH